MCGFAGFINFEGASGTAQERDRILGEMLSRLAHRGPDDEQRYDDGLMALGFRRLSIIDIEGGQQPIWNEDRRILAVVNGEIYNHLELRKRLEKNHRFRSRSDSEVILHLYEEHGLDMLQHVNGMFAVAIWDTRHRRLVLARDRLGIKPLYYTVAGDSILFASELKAMLAHPDCPRSPDWQEIQPAASLQRPLTPSFVKDIHHLPAAQVLCFEQGQEPRQSGYWSINNFFADRHAAPVQSREYYIERYGELFEKSVSDRLMSDVPLGIFLSGGVDSALITAAASLSKAGLHCFTVDEATTVETGDLAQAHRVAESLDCPLHPVRFRVNTLLDELHFDLPMLEYMVWCMDSPRFQFEWFFKHELHRYAKTHFSDIKVMLIGQGADEFAGGYSKSYTSTWQSWDDYVAGSLQRSWPDFRRREDRELGPFEEGSETMQARHMRSDFQHNMHMNLASLQFYNLWHEDRTSSSQGIESRVPFLDHRLVELLASVPPAYHADLFWNKRIVREQLSRLLPDYPPEWPKVPFINIPGRTSIPRLYQDLLKRTFPDFNHQYLASGDSLLPPQRTRQLYTRATADTGDWAADTGSLLHMMCVAIFARMCRLGSDWPVPSNPAASPLHEIH